MSSAIASAPSILSDDWLTWIRTNLDRQCSVESMVEQMVKAGVHPGTAFQGIQSMKKGGPATVTPPSKTSAVVPGAYAAPDSRLAGKTVIDIEGHRIQVMMHSKRPAITVLDNVLTPDECVELMNQSRDKLKRSTIAEPTSGERAIIKDRTSDGTWWDREANELITRIDRRLAALTGIPLNQGEGLQVMRYRVGGEYKPHFDYFPPNQAGSKVHTEKGGQRIATLLMYLQPCDEGGETAFPDVGITIVPKQGSAVYFEYKDAAGRLDAKTLHAGLPVISGEKWIATRWLRERAF